MVIDAHQHFWNYDPNRHAWISDDMSGIRRSFTPIDLMEVYAQNGIDGCVAVQVDQTLGETDFLLELAREYPFIKGIVGWADLRSNAIDRVLEKYSDNKKLKGFRHIVQGEPDPNFMIRPQFLKGIAALKAFGFTYDILVFPHQLGATLELVKRFPNQKFVIDHLAKPYVRDGFFEGWAVMMREISKYDHVYCKLSGLITEADHQSWTPAQMTCYMDLVLNSFGAKRLLFGSDWPVCLVAGSYGQVKSLVTNFIATLSIAEQEAIMGKNAVEFYNLNP
ncbi:MAG: amidohydrolase [Flavobacteriales bacterium]|nr:MAG: amidohydrolase [Flavobacteriales bacterium]